MTHFWSRRVRFDDNVIRYQYPSYPSKNLNTRWLDRRREEPRHLGYFRHMSSVQELFGKVSRRRPTTVVFGNLSRYPDLVSYNLDLNYDVDEEISIRIGGTSVDDPISTDREEEEESWWTSLINDYGADDGISTCDVLFWIEPGFDAQIKRPSRARRMIVLTSHLLLFGIDGDTLVVAHHVGGRNAVVPPLAEYVETPNENGECSACFVPDLFFGRRRPEQEGWWVGPSVCADLRGCGDARRAYLKLLNARDAIRYSPRMSSLRYWIVAIDHDIKRELMKRLVAMQSVLLTKYAKIPCNLSGMNQMVEEYVEPFFGIKGKGK